ncbi:MAG: serine/threonine protein phosphatase [Saccharothrix sp.]|nr:serine/threonine protein phosphatase [Saccharothrix sp.]
MTTRVDIAPVPRGQARLWHHTEPDFSALGVWTERIVDHGEDADPLVLYQRSTGHGMVSVFDGVGGAGRTTAGRTTDGRIRTQAWVASRRVRALVEEWFVRPSDVGLGEHIVDRLPTPATGRTRMRGTIQRDFPTTVAGLEFVVEEHEVRWHALWAGDSRCYVAEPAYGLQQLSRDDTDLSDALELLVQDPPMTNMASAGRAFALNRWTGSAPLPCLLVCATDGFFGYVTTPALFEHVLWDTLVRSHDVVHWASQLAERVRGYTGDDASLAVVALGFSEFAQLRSAFRHRAAQLDSEHAHVMNGVPDGDHAALVVAREHSWRRYRPTYERRLPDVAEPV